MQLTPSYEEFAAKYDAGENQLVYSRLAADLDTPVSVMLKLSDAQRDSFILESVTGGEIRGRYSIIGLKPDLIWRCRGEVSEINREARFDRNSFAPQDGNPLDGLRALIAECRIDMPADLPAAAAGLFGYLGYDMIRLVEHLPDINRPHRCAGRGHDPTNRCCRAGWRQRGGDACLPGMGQLRPLSPRRLCPSRRTGHGCPA